MGRSVADEHVVLGLRGRVGCELNKLVSKADVALGGRQDITAYGQSTIEDKTVEQVSKMRRCFIVTMSNLRLDYLSSFLSSAFQKFESRF